MNCYSKNPPIESNEKVIYFTMCRCNGAGRTRCSRKNNPFLLKNKIYHFGIFHFYIAIHLDPYNQLSLDKEIFEGILIRSYPWYPLLITYLPYGYEIHDIIVSRIYDFPYSWCVLCYRIRIRSSDIVHSDPSFHGPMLFTCNPFKFSTNNNRPLHCFFICFFSESSRSIGGNEFDYGFDPGTKKCTIITL